MFLDDNLKHKKVRTEYLSEFESAAWGTDHCLLLDKRHRVFSSGYSKYGRIGHGDENDLSKFFEIKELKHKKVIDVKCGHTHSLAVTRNGEIYTWGKGSFGRLGLGYDQEKRIN